MGGLSLHRSSDASSSRGSALESLSNHLLVHSAVSCLCATADP
jgi:hypothetical protein